MIYVQEKKNKGLYFLKKNYEMIMTYTNSQHDHLQISYGYISIRIQTNRAEGSTIRHNI